MKLEIETLNWNIKFKLERSCSMITNKNQLLIQAPELAKPRLTCTKFCLRCMDMVYERRSEYGNSIIHTRASNIVYFRLFFVCWPIYKNTNKCVVMPMMVVLYKKQMNNYISDISGTHERCFISKNMLNYVIFWPDAIQSSVGCTI